jgi:hypothetical protein
MDRPVVWAKACAISFWFEFIQLIPLPLLLGLSEPPIFLLFLFVLSPSLLIPSGTFSSLPVSEVRHSASLWIILAIWRTIKQTGVFRSFKFVRASFLTISQDGDCPEEEDDIQGEASKALVVASAQLRTGDDFDFDAPVSALNKQ